MLLIVDFGMGNLDSILSKLRRERVESETSSDPKAIAKADKLIIPGVGHFGAAMRNIARLGLKDALDEAVKGRGAKALGICLGAQLMAEWGEEGASPGLGWIPGRAELLRPGPGMPGLRVPHMGWSLLEMKKNPSFWPEYPPDKRFYFAHSYCVRCEEPADVVATTRHGADFVSAFLRGNVCGVQFHPEKSHRDGFGIVLNFAKGF